MRQFDEFPSGSAEWPNELSRRRFLKLMGASVALAGASGCTRNPPEHIVPYVKEAEEIIPGKPLYYASALTLGGYARGVLVETHEGHPTKIEGNPDHPASLGASDVFMQAELLTLFDPHRSKAIINAQQVSTWEALAAELSSDVLRWRGNAGSGLRLLTRHQTSPTFIAQIDRLLRQYRAAKWHEWEPLASTGPAAVYHFDKAEVIVSLGADFLASGPMSLRYTRDFTAARRPNGKMNRLYVAESILSLTGAMADHQILMRPAELEQFARDLQSGAGSTAAQIIAQDLRAHMSKSVVIAGEFEPAAIQNSVRTLNDSLQNTGSTVDYIPSSKHGAHEFGELVDEMRSGAVETLMIIGSNAAFDAPVDREFSRLLPKIAHSVHIGLYRDETAELCQSHIPETHELESWDDACAADGTATIMQPVIEPLFGGHSRHELLALLLGETPATSYDVVRAFWQTQHGGPDFEKFWRKSVHDGVVAGWKAPAGQPVVAISSQAAPSHEPAGKSGLNLLIRPSARMYDGRFANNAWLQELPDPLTTIVWDNAALISAATAHRLE
ncbi:MAG TPA: hypothetical protein VE758_01695, partial [Chthoniobacterales bacterium]|nr:hypothetical protein [Chthoniobacterales bacterium]